MKPADEAMVSLYSIVAHADEPVTFEELVAKMPPAMRHDAMKAWTAEWKEQGFEIPDSYWTPNNRDAAWRWWIDSLLAAAVHNQRLKVSRSKSSSAADVPVSGARVGREGQAFVPGARTPMVSVPTTVLRLKPWSAEFDALGRKHGASIRVLENAKTAQAKIQARLRDKEDKEFLLAFIADAELALRNT